MHGALSDYDVVKIYNDVHLSSVHLSQLINISYFSGCRDG